MIYFQNQNLTSVSCYEVLPPSNPAHPGLPGSVYAPYGQPAHGSPNNSHNRLQISNSIVRALATQMTASDQSAFLKLHHVGPLHWIRLARTGTPSVCCPNNQRAPATFRHEPNKDRTNRAVPFVCQCECLCNPKRPISSRRLQLSILMFT